MIFASLRSILSQRQWSHTNLRDGDAGSRLTHQHGPERLYPNRIPWLKSFPSSLDNCCNTHLLPATQNIIYSIVCTHLVQITLWKWNCVTPYFKEYECHLINRSKNKYNEWHPMFKNSIQNCFQVKTHWGLLSLLESGEKQRIYLLALWGDFLLNVIRRIKRGLLKTMFIHHRNHRDTLTMLCFHGKKFLLPLSAWH